MQKNLRFVLGPIILVGALSALVLTGMKSNTMRAVPVDELRRADESSKTFVSQRLRVVGFIGKKPIRKTALQTAGGMVNVAHFQIEDKGKMLDVEFRDALPDTFRAGGPVQVDGVYVSNGVMKAEHVLTKCPSKYEAGKSGGENASGAKNGDKSYAPSVAPSAAQNVSTETEKVAAARS